MQLIWYACLQTCNSVKFTWSSFCCMNLVCRVSWLAFAILLQLSNTSLHDGCCWLAVVWYVEAVIKCRWSAFCWSNKYLQPPTSIPAHAWGLLHLFRSAALSITFFGCWQTGKDEAQHMLPDSKATVPSLSSHSISHTHLVNSHDVALHALQPSFPVPSQQKYNVI